MKKTIRLTEADLTRIIKRVIKEQAADNSLKASLLKLVGAGTGRHYKQICALCSKQEMNYNNSRAKKAANEFNAAIRGGDNPFSNFGGGVNKNSPAYKAGMAIQNNLQTAEDICDMIQYYSTWTGSGEDFCEAVSGELNYKVDSTTNLDLMVGEPIFNVLNKIR